MRVEDIRPSAAMADQAAAMQADIDWLAARRDAFVPVGCPACGNREGRPLYEKYSMRHQSCPDCGTQYVNPRPDDRMLAEFYARSENYAYWAKHVFPQSREARREMLFRPRAQRAVELARERGLGGGAVVEVGAAHGLFCDEVRKLGAFSRVIAIEPTPDLAAECRALGLETIEAPFEQVSLEGDADVVANFEVIEHLFDPGAFLAWCHALLKPGGLLFVTCPNIAGFETLLLGRDSDTVDHEHLNLFTPAGLELLAQRNGFFDVSVETPGELDVEIVRKAVQDGDVGEERLGPVLSRLLSRDDEAVLRRLQAVLAEAKLSSHMWLIARKAKETSR